MLFDHDALLGSANQNRFLLLDLRDSAFPAGDKSLGKLPPIVCATPFVDDVIVLVDSPLADFRIRIFGGDGREADFCCNGALVSLGRIADTEEKFGIDLETKFGIREGYSDTVRSSLNFGKVTSGSFAPTPEIQHYLQQNGAEILGARIAGEPHLVLQSVKHGYDWQVTRSKFESFCAPLIDACGVIGGVNVTVIFLSTVNTLVIRTFERGARRMTASCGSGALAAAAQVYEDRNPSHSIRVISPGGFHELEFDQHTESWIISSAISIWGHAPLREILDAGMVDPQTECYSVEFDDNRQLPISCSRALYEMARI